MTKSKRQRRIENLEDKLDELTNSYGLNPYRYGWYQTRTGVAIAFSLQYLDGYFVEHGKTAHIYFNPDTGARVRAMYGDLTGHKGNVPPHINIDTIYSNKGPNYHLELIDFGDSLFPTPSSVWSIYKRRKIN